MFRIFIFILIFSITMIGCDSSVTRSNIDTLTGNDLMTYNIEKCIESWGENLKESTVTVTADKPCLQKLLIIENIANGKDPKGLPIVGEVLIWDVDESEEKKWAQIGFGTLDFRLDALIYFIVLDRIWIKDTDPISLQKVSVKVSSVFEDEDGDIYVYLRG